jgi:hypothetical protein
MSFHETCLCGHDKSSHYLEPMTSEGYLVRGACLSLWCKCLSYEKREPKRANAESLLGFADE